MGRVLAVACDAQHRFSKQPTDAITVATGLGVVGDAHHGPTVRHRSRARADPTQPNLRQVHLLQGELLDELLGKGWTVAPSALGENITTRQVDLLGLPLGARLRIGRDVVLEVTGLRNPCAQIERFQPGLLAAVLDRAPDGALIRKTGIMSIVVAGGIVRPGDPIGVETPPPPHRPLQPV